MKRVKGVKNTVTEDIRLWMVSTPERTERSNYKVAEYLEFIQRY